MYYSVKMFIIIFNQDYAKTIIYCELALNQNHKKYILNWIDELEKSIKNNDSKNENEYIDLIKKTIEDRNCFEIMQSHIPDLFDISFKNHSFIDSYMLILKLNHCDFQEFDEPHICYNQIMKIKYYNDGFLIHFDFYSTIVSVIERLKIRRDLKIMIVASIVSAVLQNSIIRSKYSIIDDCFNALSILRDSYGEGQLRSDIILNIFKNDIILNLDFEESKKLHMILLRSLYANNINNTDKSFIGTISKMFRGFYFYGVLEIETIKKERREKIIALEKSEVDSFDNVLISMPLLIEKNEHDVLEYLISDTIDNDSLMDFMDYFPRGGGAKNAVWTNENKIKFAFWFYALTGYDFSVFPLTTKHIIYNDQKQAIKAGEICNAILEQYNHTDKSLSKYCLNEIYDLQPMLYNSTILPLQYFEETYDNINSKLQEINEYKIKTLTNVDDNIEAELFDLLSNKPIVNIDKTISLEGANTYQLPYQINIKQENQDKIIAREIQLQIKNIVNQIIKSDLPVLKLSFDSNGINKLLEKLKLKNYKFRNYTFIDDFAIDKETRKTSEYQQLYSIIGKIPKHFKNNIDSKLFLLVDDIFLNTKIVSCKPIDLDDEKVEEYINRYRVSENRYMIDNAIYNKVAAVPWVKKTRYFVSAKIQLVTNISSKSGFRIQFDNKC